MKNILKSLCIIGLFTLLSINNWVSANNTQNKIFKELNITTTQVQKDYWKKLNESLDLYFNKARYYNSRNQLLSLENALEKSLVKYKQKDYLTLNQRKKYNLLQNMYYRSKILTLYYVK